MFTREKAKAITCADPEGGGGRCRGSRPPANHHNIGFPMQYRSGCPEKLQLPSQHSMLGHHGHASETPFDGFLLAG